MPSHLRDIRHSVAACLAVAVLAVPISQSAIAQTEDTEPAVTVESDIGLPCGLSVEASALPAAMIALDVIEPCQPGMRIDVAHAGLTFAATTDDFGLMTVDVPAFSSPAIITITLPDGTQNRVDVEITGLEEYDRVAVTWGDRHRLELHALVEDAEFGGPGHIWQEAPGQIADALTGVSGVLTVLGDETLENPRRAQVYTFPRSTLAAPTQMRLSVDIPITETSCGQDIRARGLQMFAGVTAAPVPIRLSLPGCDAIGDYLMLRNVYTMPAIESN